MSKTDNIKVYCDKCNTEYEFIGMCKNIAEANCPKCDSILKNNYKIEIHINGGKNVPKVFIDGKEVKVCSIRYAYETETNQTHGENDMYMEVATKDEIRVIGFKNWS